MALVPTIEHRHPQRHQPTATAAPRPALASRYVPIVHGRRGRAECAGSGRAARPGTGTSAGVRHPVERQAADRRQDTSDTKHPATAAPAPNNDKPEPTCRWRRGWGHRGLRYPAIRPATSAMSITAGGAGWRRPCSASDCCRLRHPMGAELLGDRVDDGGQRAPLVRDLHRRVGHGQRVPPHALGGRGPCRALGRVRVGKRGAGEQDGLAPGATITNGWHRSARCLPSIVHSSVRDRPNPGTEEPCSGAV